MCSSYIVYLFKFILLYVLKRITSYCIEVSYQVLIHMLPENCLLLYLYLFNGHVCHYLDDTYIIYGLFSHQEYFILCTYSSLVFMLHWPLPSFVLTINKNLTPTFLIFIIYNQLISISNDPSSSIGCTHMPQLRILEYSNFLQLWNLYIYILLINIQRI